MAPKAKKSLDEEALDEYAKLIQLTNEQEIRKIVAHALQTAKEFKHYTTYVEHSFFDARKPFGLHTPYANWLRAVDRQMQDSDTPIDAKVAIIEKFPMPRTEAGKKDWLFELNVQMRAYFGKNIEVVFKDKK